MGKNTQLSHKMLSKAEDEWCERWKMATQHEKQK